MIFEELEIGGVFVVTIERLDDERGWFGRVFSAAEFAARGLDAAVAECSVSFNARRGTLRGMHYQRQPFGESKLVRCTRGSISDVAVDLRSDSPTRHRWVSAELTQDNDRMLFIPPGVAHGFQTLEDATEVSYQISARYAPDHSAGVRWNDPAFGIAWPMEPTVISARDAAFEDFGG